MSMQRTKSKKVGTSIIYLRCLFFYFIFYESVQSLNNNDNNIKFSDLFPNRRRFPRPIRSFIIIICQY